jgi:hypothetical protein
MTVVALNSQKSPITRLGTAINGKYHTSVKSDNDKIVFDVEKDGEVLSIEVRKGIKAGETYRPGLTGLDNKIKNYTLTYTLNPSINGVKGEPIDVSHVVEQYRVDVSEYNNLKKGLADWEHKIILDDLKKVNSNLAKMWEKCIPNSEEMEAGTRNSVFNKMLSEFVNG